MLFCVWEDVWVRAHWNHSFHMHLTCLGSVSCFLNLSVLSSGLTLGSGCNLMAVREQIFFSFLSSLRSHLGEVPSSSPWRAAIADDYDILTEKAMATHSTTLAWEIPLAEEPGRLQYLGSLRIRHDWATSLSLFTFMHWRWKWQPTPVFLPGESQGWGSLVGCRLWGRTE